MVCRDMQFSRYPLDAHVCQFKLSSCESQKKLCFRENLANNLIFLFRRLRCQADEDQWTFQLRPELAAGPGVLHRHQGAGPWQQTLCRGGE